MDSDIGAKFKALRAKSKHSLRSLQEASNLAKSNLQKLESADDYAPLLSTIERFSRTIAPNLYTPPSQIMLEVFEVYFARNQARLDWEKIAILKELSKKRLAKGFWKLTELRKVHGFSLNKLADAAGIDKQTLGNIESGKHASRLSSLLKVSAALAPGAEKPPSEVFMDVVASELARSSGEA